MLSCAAQMAPSERSHKKEVAKASGVLAVVHVPYYAERYARYSVVFSAAHLAAFGHGLFLQQDRDLPVQIKKQRESLSPQAARVHVLLTTLQRLAGKQSSTATSWDWLLLLTADAVILSNENVVHRALQSESLTKKTHVIVSARRRDGDILDSGAVIVKNAKWTEGFLVAWLQELHVPGNEAVALRNAVDRARKLGGQDAVVVMPAGQLSASMRERSSQTQSTRHEPIIHLLDDADEVREHFFRSALTWACRRPGGLWSGNSVFRRLYTNALAASIRKILSANRGQPIALHQHGHPITKHEHTSAVLDPFSALLGEGDGLQMLELCLAGYEWATDLESPGALRCEDEAGKLSGS